MSAYPTPRPLATYLSVVGLGLLSTYFLTGEWITRFNETNASVWGWRQTVGVGFLLAAMGCGIRFFGRSDDFHHESSREGEPVGWKAFVPAVALYVAACAWFLHSGESAGVRWLWGGSVVALLVPWCRSRKFGSEWSLTASEYFLLLGVLATAFVLRYWNLTGFPLHVDNDVSIMALFSRNMLEMGDARWIGMAETDHLFSEHQYIAWSMRLFGVNHYGLCMASVVFGTATCAVVFYYGKLFFNAWVGVVAAALLAFNPVHIHFSRLLFGPVATFFVALGGLFLLHGLKTSRRLSFALGGIALGAGLLDYYSARIAPVVLFALFLVWWFQRKRDSRITLGHWAIVAAGMLFSFGPNLVFSFIDFSDYSGRGKQVILWTDPAWRHLSDKYQSHGQAWIVIWEQTKRALLAPFYFPDESTICHFRRPMLGALTALGFIAGLGFCFRRMFQTNTLFLLLWMAVTVICGGILTIDPPFWPHLNIAVPAMTLVAAIGLERVIRGVIVGRGKAVSLGVPAVMVAGILYSGLHEWEMYERFAKGHATGRVLAYREITQIPKDHRVYLVSDDTRWDQETFQFFLRGWDGQTLKASELIREIPVLDKPTVYFVFSEVDAAALETLVQAYPHARREGFWDGWGWPVFTRIDVYPQGYAAIPQLANPPSPSLFTLPGWWLIFGVILGLVVVGVRLLASAAKEGKGFPRAPVES